MRSAAGGSTRIGRWAGWLLVAAALQAGCDSGPDLELRSLVDRGEFGQARARLEGNPRGSASDRDVMLNRMRLGIVDLADGHPDAAEPVFNEVFQTLRTQGINDDKTVEAAVFGEGGTIFWKGEPFEQALAFGYISVEKAVRGEWDNARAAAASSLFLLKDFGENERGSRKTTEEIAEEAFGREAAARSEKGAGYEAYLDKGYTPVKTDFALGYLLNGIANLALADGDPAREDEARDNLREAFTLRPGLKPLADRLVTRRANTVFIVDYGPGPQKLRYGPDDALARFEPRLASDQRPLVVSVDGSPGEEFPAACDVNAMASDHMWNNLEDLRRAKSAIGNAMLIGGAVTAGASRNQTGQLVGLGLVLGGLVAKATSAADTRHCEVMPQRVYAAGVRIDRPGSVVTLAIGRDPGVRMVLPGIDPPEAGRTLAMHFVRLASRAARDGPWIASSRVVYASDSYGGRVEGDELPYILGGKCVRTPSETTLRRYQQAGYLTDMTLADLRNLFRAEGIDVFGEARLGNVGLHVLEGGASLAAPVAGSAGFVRLFCVEHRPYTPRSREARELTERLRRQRPPREGSAPAAASPIGADATELGRGR